ncbi:MAG: methyltransferase domain-containing protein [Alphaproteobacteria bacterium]|jgi:SAM-dependent methyltransferase|tara:strand:+ start:13296 stop:14174 length:879 start_codon:yes stop_codon:yes gene_type:complete
MNIRTNNIKKKIFNKDVLKACRKRSLKLIPKYSFSNYLNANISERIQEINKKFQNSLTITNNLEDSLWVESIGYRIKNNFNGLLSMNDKNKNINMLIDEEILPFKNECFDLIVSNLNLHSTVNLGKLLLEINKTLIPDGLFIGSMFGRETLNELRYSLLSAETEITGKTYPRIIPFTDIRTSGDLLYKSGFKLCVSDIDRVVLEFDQPIDLIHQLRAIGETNYLNIDRLPINKKVWKRACEIYKNNFSNNKGLVKATFDIITLTGWKYDKKQQEPLKPGSATHKLSDALNKR